MAEYNLPMNYETVYRIITYRWHRSLWCFLSV